jgi:hypothetical protein
VEILAQANFVVLDPVLGNITRARDIHQPNGCTGCTGCTYFSWVADIQRDVAAAYGRILRWGMLMTAIEDALHIRRTVMTNRDRLTITLRARWSGDDPVPGTLLASPKGRVVYRVLEVWRVRTAGAQGHGLPARMCASQPL